MNKFWRAKFWLSTLITSICVVLSYEVKTRMSGISPIYLVLGSFILGSYGAQAAVNGIVKFKIGRMLVIGNAWIEGYWYLHTFPTDGKSHPITNDGIVYISYEGDSQDVAVKTYRRAVGDLRTGFSSLSDLVAVRSSDLRFLNYYTIPEGKKEARGITIGRFFGNGFRLYPNLFEGTSVLLEEGVYRRQAARKIPGKDVRKLKRKYKENWMDAALAGELPSLLPIAQIKNSDAQAETWKVRFISVLKDKFGR